MKPKTPNTAALNSALTGAIKIEKGIPIPRGQKTGFHATLRSMEIGDSFFLPFSSQDAKIAAKFQTNICARCAQFTRANSAYRFTVRRVIGGYRAWRIEPTTK